MASVSRYRPAEDVMIRVRAFVATSLVAAGMFGASVLAGAPPAADQDKLPSNNAAMGSYFYKTYCASCHGASARGDGPLAGSMRRRPANLTEIAKRNKGVYPNELVYKIIDGRQPLAGHGGPDMPIWGDAFLRSAETSTEETVRHRIQALVDYLETIQAKDTQ
jgi:mono/diheme cytochrome c family protein